MAMEFVVTPERLAMANRVLKEKTRELTQDQIYDLFDEIRWGDQISLDSTGGKLRFILSPVQTVMLAAGFAALVEARGEQAIVEGVTPGDGIPF